MAHQLTELADCGFEANPEIYDAGGCVLKLDDDLHAIDFFNIVARKLN